MQPLGSLYIAKGIDASINNDLDWLIYLVQMYLTAVALAPVSLLMLLYPYLGFIGGFLVVVLRMWVPFSTFAISLIFTLITWRKATSDGEDEHWYAYAYVQTAHTVLVNWLTYRFTPMAIQYVNPT